MAGFEPITLSPATRAPARRTRLAVTLGAAVAIGAGAFIGLDVPSSFAEGGLFDLLFSDGGGHHRIVEPLSYGGYWRVHAPGGRRHAARHKAHRRIVAWHGVKTAAHAHLLRRRVARHIDPSLDARQDTGLDMRSFVAAAPESAPATSGRRIVCVRSCDGVFFPLPASAGGRGASSQQAACDRVCPGAETRVYSIPAGSDKIEDAVSQRDGARYADLVGRLNGATSDKARACSCNAAADAGAGGAVSAAYLNDPTLRPGDTVVTPQGVRVVRSGSHFPFKHADFLSLAETRDVSTEKRGALAAIERVLKTPRGRVLLTSGAARHEAAQ